MIPYLGLRIRTIISVDDDVFSFKNKTNSLQLNLLCFHYFALIFMESRVKVHQTHKVADKYVLTINMNMNISHYDFLLSYHLFLFFHLSIHCLSLILTLFLFLNLFIPFSFNQQTQGQGQGQGSSFKPPQQMQQQHAIHYVTTIRNRFANEPDTYRFVRTST